VQRKTNKLKAFLSAKKIRKRKKNWMPTTRIKGQCQKRIFGKEIKLKNPEKKELTPKFCN
jgi:hypothetical protein